MMPELTWHKSSYSGSGGGECVEVATIPDTALTWHKSTHSGSEGGQCVEVATTPDAALTWHKSTHSGGEGGDCVQVATAPGAPADPVTIHVRDSKDPGGPRLTFTPEAWTAFTAFAGSVRR